MNHTKLSTALPREHGAWAMFFVPLILGIGASNRLNLNMVLFFITGFGFFLVRYPLMLVIKSRDVNVRANALRWSAIYSALSAVSGAMLMALTMEWRLVPIGLLGVVSLGIYLWLVSRRAEMSLAGEWIGIAGLALGMPGVYLVATGVLDTTALALYLLNLLYFGGTIFYIKFKVREQFRLVAPNATWQQKMSAGALTLVYHILVMVFVVALAAIGFVPMLAALAFLLPMCKVVTGVLTRPAKLNVPRLGFIELGVTTAFAIIVLWAYR